MHEQLYREVLQRIECGCKNTILHNVNYRTFITICVIALVSDKTNHPINHSSTQKKQLFSAIVILRYLDICVIVFFLRDSQRLAHIVLMSYLNIFKQLFIYYVK